LHKKSKYFGGSEVLAFFDICYRSTEDVELF